MGKSIVMGITTIILFISLLLSALIVASVITDESSQTYDEEDYIQMEVSISQKNSAMLLLKILERIHSYEKYS